MKGKETDFDAWYTCAHPRVLATLVLVTGNVHVAADATDEAFCRAVTKWRTVSCMASPIDWTTRVAINVARRRWRSADSPGRAVPRRTPVA